MGSRCSVDLAADSGEWARLLSRDERPHMTQSWSRRGQGGRGGLATVSSCTWRRPGGHASAARQVVGQSALGLAAPASGCSTLTLRQGTGWFETSTAVWEAAGLAARSSTCGGAGGRGRESAPASRLAFGDRGGRGWCSFPVDLRLGEEQLGKNLSRCRGSRCGRLDAAIRRWGSPSCWRISSGSSSRGEHARQGPRRTVTGLIRPSVTQQPMTSSSAGRGAGLSRRRSGGTPDRRGVRDSDGLVRAEGPQGARGATSCACGPLSNCSAVSALAGPGGYEAVPAPGRSRRAWRYPVRAAQRVARVGRSSAARRGRHPHRPRPRARAARSRWRMARRTAIICLQP